MTLTDSMLGQPPLDAFGRARRTGAGEHVLGRIFLCATLIIAALAACAAPALAKPAARKTGTPVPSPSPTAVVGFGFPNVAAIAEARSHEPYREPQKVPDFLLHIGYDDWRRIRFRPDASLWRDKQLPFEVQFFHPGLYYDRIVKINEIDGSDVHPVPFSPSQFDYAEGPLASQVPQDLGYAGFRVHYPIKSPDYRDEVIVFLGASYFRAVGRDEGFGISARGLAIDTALPSGEEFPFFDEFWLVEPQPGATSMEIYALLDSPSITGAYKFVVKPDVITQVDVEARLFRRRDVQKLGIAPLTSMFLAGEGTVPAREDYRPEVHDSDGLQIELGTGEWLWRPLDNPRSLRVSDFSTENPHGFGLIQRDRMFDHFQDLETHPEQRPSAWITPTGGNVWQKGRVELVEIPTEKDINDNIAAFWIPEGLPPVNEPLEVSYQMAWYGADTTRPPGGRVVDTRRDRGGKEGAIRFIIDFDGDELRALPPDTNLRGVITIASGDAEIVDQQVMKNTGTGGWRFVFQVRPKSGDSIELRAFLDHGGKALTETWSYRLEP